MSQTTTLTFAVGGMNCRSCVRHIGEALAERFAGLEHAIDLERKTLTVSFSPEAASEAAIAETLAEAGYPLTRLPAA